jgi:hypothetical protein
MAMRIDTADVGYTKEARALLDSLDDSTFVSLGVLFGADLCVLDGTGHHASWKALKSAWQQLTQQEQERIIEASTRAMLDRDLITEHAPGRGVEALIVPASYKLGTQLRVLLSARESPAFMIATHYELRTPAVTYFQPLGDQSHRSGDPRADGRRRPGARTEPAGRHVQLPPVHQAFAAGELARWALKPVQVPRYEPKPPRLISFFGRAEGGRANSYQLTILSNGKKAHIDGLDISADLDRQQLTHFMTDIVAKWANTHRSMLPKPV